MPTPLIRHAFCFILASLAKRYRVGIVSYALMCSHIHLLVVDLGEEGKPSDLPRFRSVLRSTFAQFIRWYWERECGCIFCPDSVGKSIKIVDLNSIEEVIAYIETNPMAAGMEKSPKMMKCAVSQREWLLEPFEVERPSVYFQKRTWGERATLRLVVPPEAVKQGHTPESFYELTSNVLQKAVKKLQRERKRAGKRARPLHVIERLRPEDGGGKSSADHSEVLVCCQDPVRRALELDKIRAFRNEHKRAMRDLRDGVDDVVFPPGTYKAARHYGVRVRPQGDDPNLRRE